MLAENYLPAAGAWHVQYLNFPYLNSAKFNSQGILQLFQLFIHHLWNT
jgi:hypothetical protein